MVHSFGVIQTAHRFVFPLWRRQTWYQLARRQSFHFLRCRFRNLIIQKRDGSTEKPLTNDGRLENGAFHGHSVRFIVAFYIASVGCSKPQDGRFLIAAASAVREAGFPRISSH